MDDIEGVGADRRRRDNWE